MKVTKRWKLIVQLMHCVIVSDTSDNVVMYTDDWVCQTTNSNKRSLSLMFRKDGSRTITNAVWLRQLVKNDTIQRGLSSSPMSHSRPTVNWHRCNTKNMGIVN